MATVKTYILAPNFTYHVGTSICMGDIIQDPNDPTKPLSSPPDSSTSDTESHLDYDATLSKQKTRSLNGSIWAKFLETMDASIGGGVSDDVLDKYTMDRLETIYFKKQPTDEEATERIKDKKVKAAVNSGLLESGKTSKREGNATFQVPVTSEVAIGTDVSLSSTGDTQQSYSSGQDIIFAYQLHVIAHRGWRRRDVDIRVHKPKAAFLNEGKEVVEEEPAETSHAREEDIRAFDEEMPVDVLTATDGDEPCVCIVFKEE
ncbi:hypothetical protein CDV31_005300 [Fusarium ambrosium]|uniref:Uncharacterized protein n=1 Tax=Fusarium ambrosium TaxID=131363 RepID=A0A428UK84_9HYPO|nr:hypothetical protein CDV31_005300 [Fusarium ambrosium]